MHLNIISKVNNNNIPLENDYSENYRIRIKTFKLFLLLTR